jgi:hypothetical protein
MTSSSRIRRFVLGVVLLFTFPLAWLLRPWVDANPVSPCLFFTLSGKPCLFCGLTRAFVHAAHGEWAKAHGLHPFWWVAALLVLAAGIISLSDALNNQDRLARLWHSKVVSWTTLVLLIVASAVRALFLS